MTSSIHLVSIFILLLHSIETKPMRRISVMISESEPFASHANRPQSFRGLDIKIMENFAKKLGLSIEYITTNECLNEVFSSKNHTDNLFRSIKHLYESNL